MNVWKIAIRKCNENKHFWDVNDYAFELIEMPVRYWAADPFLFPYNGEEYLFYELYDKITRRGYIAYSKITENGVTKPKIVIKKPYHMSFPYIFLTGNEIYMIPETSGDHTIQLYKAVSFPDVWQSENMLSDIVACDTVICEEGNSKFLLTSLTDNGDCCCVSNVAYRLDESLRVNGAPIPCISGDKGVRNGGAIFNYEDKTVRVGQDCSGHSYGKGLCFWYIKSIDPYVEESFFDFTVDEMAKHINSSGRIYGVHTYNFDSKYEVVDVLYNEKYPKIISALSFLHRAFGFVNRRICAFFARS